MDKELLQEILSQLNELQNKCSDLSFDIKFNQDKIKLSDVFNFPEEVSDLLIEIISNIEYLGYPEEENVEQDEDDLEEIDNKPFIINNKVDYDSLEDYGYQYTDKELSDKLELPEEYREKSVALRKYKSSLIYIENKETKTKNSNFYELCLDPGEDSEISSSDCWFAVDDKNIIFKNDYCSIYKIKDETEFV